MALPLFAGAIERSTNLSADQTPAGDGWTVVCSLQAKGVDTSLTYTGYLLVQYSDSNGNVKLAEVPYTLSPTARQFREESVGQYKASGRLSKGTIAVSIELTRYGPMSVYPYTTYTSTGGEFACTGRIDTGSGSTLNNILWAQHRTAISHYLAVP